MIRYDSRSSNTVFYLNPVHVVGVKGFYDKAGVELDKADIYTTDSSHPWEVFGKASDIVYTIDTAIALGKYV